MLTRAQEEFARRVYRTALSLGPAPWLPNGVEPWKARWMTAIAVLETGWGRHIPCGHDADGRVIDSHNIIGEHWIPGSGARHVLCREGATGSLVYYRVFESEAACLWLLLRKIEIDDPEPDNPGYVAARRAYLALRDQDEEAARQAWILEFSRAYCPSNPGHGRDVLSIYLQLREVVGDDG